ncbi:TetR/AcrR family transcriptional regulator [Neorhizobium sp. T25_13]|uniref:TetR/AcrR family transcriptional regulator n=1 Tax=Neorhizobium sp. T25_13 TaxID=2093830 RepID=UPI000CF895D0|nr:TetR/AcrR family transcriptional regulator [Neorhizobium sp. T25_13]
MPVGSIDRRVTRTRGLLQQALVKLTTEKGYTAVTVEDICRQANVGRSTFYTHYPDKDCLRKAAIDEHLKPLQTRDANRGLPPSTQGFSFSRSVFEHALATRAMHRALIGGTKRETPEEIHDWISKQIRRELAGLSGHHESRAELEIATRFVVGALLEVMHWWLDRDTDITPAEIDRMFQQMVLNGVKTALDAPADASD